MKIKKFKDYKMIKKTDVESWISNIGKFSRREAKETRIAGLILSKVIKNKSGLSDDKPTKEEIKFLKDHSKDLLKIFGFLITRPTPIPYLLIIIALRKLGVNLFPSLDDLEIPDNYKKSTPEIE